MQPQQLAGTMQMDAYRLDWVRGHMSLSQLLLLGRGRSRPRSILRRMVLRCVRPCQKLLFRLQCCLQVLPQSRHLCTAP